MDPWTSFGFFGGSLNIRWVFWWLLKDLLNFLVDLWSSMGSLVDLCTSIGFSVVLQRSVEFLVDLSTFIGFFGGSSHIC